MYISPSAHVAHLLTFCQRQSSLFLALTYGSLFSKKKKKKEKKATKHRTHTRPMPPVTPGLTEPLPASMGAPASQPPTAVLPTPCAASFSFPLLFFLTKGVETRRLTFSPFFKLLTPSAPRLFTNQCCALLTGLLKRGWGAPSVAHPGKCLTFFFFFFEEKERLTHRLKKCPGPCVIAGSPVPLQRLGRVPGLEPRGFLWAVPPGPTLASWGCPGTLPWLERTPLEPTWAGQLEGWFPGDTGRNATWMGAFLFVLFCFVLSPIWKQ